MQFQEVGGPGGRGDGGMDGRGMEKLFPGINTTLSQWRLMDIMMVIS